MTFGRRGDDIRLLAVDQLAHGTRIAFAASGTSYRHELALAGTFQAHNALAALGLAIATGIPAETAAPLLARLEGVRGRLELVARHPAGAPVYVDYAHKPLALETILSALRPHTGRRLVVVFGCGGDRDRGKRPIMGEIAARLADRVIVTDDNPRGEDPAAIRAAILAGAPAAIEIGDRAAAIRQAVAGLQEGDLLVIAGKGHETGQIIGDDVRPFDDAVEARAAIAGLEGGAGC